MPILDGGIPLRNDARKVHATATSSKIGGEQRREAKKEEVLEVAREMVTSRETKEAKEVIGAVRTLYVAGEYEPALALAERLIIGRNISERDRYIPQAYFLKACIQRYGLRDDAEALKTFAETDKILGNQPSDEGLKRIVNNNITTLRARMDDTDYTPKYQGPPTVEALLEKVG